MKKFVFRGAATALVTPFRDGMIDFPALSRLIDIQLRSEIDALVIAGTTGECATLDETERISLFEFTAERVAGRVPLIFGTGSNDTKLAKRYTKIAERMGASAALSVTPFYNKGTEEGIIKHYLEITADTELPIILYNVPSRTGVNLSLRALERLARSDTIVGIKEASDSVDRLTALSTLCDELHLYSGNDSQIYATLALGGAGVISVVSNIIPRTVTELCRMYFDKDTDGALRIQKELLPLIRVMFAETNPTPIKYALSLRGLMTSEMRLPFTAPEESTRAIIKEAVEKYRDLS